MAFRFEKMQQIKKLEPFPDLTEAGNGRERDADLLQKSCSEKKSTTFHDFGPTDPKSWNVVAVV